MTLRCTKLELEAFPFDLSALSKNTHKSFLSVICASEASLFIAVNAILEILQHSEHARQYQMSSNYAPTC